MLQKFRDSQLKEDQKDVISKIRLIPLETLEKEKITFGQAKLGMPFTEVFQDAKWTDWFIRTYEKSGKPEHQMFVQYVTKRIDEGIIMEHRKGYQKTSMTATSNSSQISKDVTESWDQMTEPGMLQDFELPGISKVQQMEEQVTNLSQENKNLSDRMAGMEMAMNELLQHVRNLSVKSEP